MTEENAIAAARRRVQEAKEKVGRQQRRYAMQAVEGEAVAKSEKAQAAKALLLELEVELDIAENELRKLERESPAGQSRR